MPLAELPNCLQGPDYLVQVFQMTILCSYVYYVSKRAQVQLRVFWNVYTLLPPLQGKLTTSSFAHLYHFSLKKKNNTPPPTCAVILTKGFCSFPQCRGNSKEDSCVTFTNYSSKTKSKLLQNVIQALDLNSKHGEERLTEKTKYKKHSNAEQRA